MSNNNSAITLEQEANYVKNAIREIKKDKNWEKASIIAVVRPECKEKLRSKCSCYQSKFRVLDQKPLIRVTSRDQLNEAVDELEKHPRRSQAWVMVISGLIPDLSFNINADIDSLHITRVRKADPERALLISGGSTWNGIRFDDWQNEPRQRSLTLDDNGVTIAPEYFGSDPWSTASFDKFDQSKHKEVQNHMENLASITMDGLWWEKVQKPIADLFSLSGLTIGTLRAYNVTKSNNEGIFLKVQYASLVLNVGGINVQPAARERAQVPPTAVEKKAPSLVYFIPWIYVFLWVHGWLQSIRPSLWDTICELWDTICTLWDQFWSKIKSLLRRQHRAR